MSSPRAHRRHTMPFGAEWGLTTGARFRLWAPGATRVELELARGPGREILPMTVLPDGWFEARVADAVPGTRYGFRVEDRLTVPDPASRWNPDDVHGLSAVVDPFAFDWPDDAWRGRPWEEAVVYELHVGTFTAAGTFRAAIERLDDLVDLGVTAIELMPVADFPGARGWGYDGVLPFAPDAAYGTPDELKALIAAAHARGLMVLLDVVYNHFGPEGNYLHVYAQDFFNPRHQTPWGAAVNFDGERARTVRDFFVHNALYWIEEFHFDGLRLDAVHAIADDSRPDIVEEIAATVRAGPGRDRHVHIVLENDHNQARYLRRDGAQCPALATAQWNDDIHHALHVLAVGETDGYYADYAERPLHQLGRCLAEGFAYQGDPSPYRGGQLRGEPSAHLPATAFVVFTQTHDQVGNRAFGERIAALADPPVLRAAIACTLLSPAPPMLFMGEEFAASSPFLFFCDFGPDLAAAVTRGRREEFGRFARFRDPAVQASIPDPNAPATFARSKLDWTERDRGTHREWLEFYRRCLRVRRERIVPHLAGMAPGGDFQADDDGLLAVRWRLAGGMDLQLVANFATTPRTSVPMPGGEMIFASGPARYAGGTAVDLAAYEVVVVLGRNPSRREEVRA